MNKLLALTLAFTLSALLPVFAAPTVVPFPDAQVEITVPENWTQEAKDGKLTISAPDKTMSVVFFAVTGSSDSADFDKIDESIEKDIGKVAWLRDSKGEPWENNGMKGEVYNGTAKDGTLQVECIWLVSAPEKHVYIYWFDNPASEKKYTAEIDTIVKGLKPLAKKEAGSAQPAGSGSAQPAGSGSAK